MSLEKELFRGVVLNNDEYDIDVKEPNDLYYAMSASNEGDAVVTISNHHTGAAAGATFDVPVNVG